MMGEGDFIKSLCGESTAIREVDVPLGLILELAECRGRMLAMRDYARAHKYNFNSADLSIIGGFESEESKENATV